MAKQDIFIGTVANDGTGTNWRTAWGYTDDNFNEMYGGMTESSIGIVTPSITELTVDPDVHHYFCTPSASDFVVNLTNVPSLDEEYVIHYDASTGDSAGRIDIDPSGNTINSLDNFYLYYDNEMVTVKWMGTEWKAF